MSIPKKRIGDPVSVKLEPARDTDFGTDDTESRPAPKRKAKVPHPLEGKAVRGSGQPIWLVQDGKRCHIPSWERFKDLGFADNQLAHLSDEELAAIPLGEPLSNAMVPKS